jgi:hypothetical protein
MPLGGVLHISTKEPPVPKDAEFGIRIDFKRGEKNPERVFQAAEAMIRALQKLDHTLCGAIDNKIEPIMVLEEIESGSLIVWLRNLLTRVDDDALKTLEWKPIVGRYLVRAKWVYIDWSNKPEGERSLWELAKSFRNLAAETDIHHLPAYAPPSLTGLAESIKSIETAKSYLTPEDKMSLLEPDGLPKEFDLQTTLTEEELQKQLIKESVKAENMPMTLIVKKPDYLGKSKWDFRHGTKTVSTNIGDEPWLVSFQARKKDVRPGDALKVLADIEHHYGYDNELVSETVVIKKVLEVLENEYHQREMDL